MTLTTGKLKDNLPQGVGIGLVDFQLDDTHLNYFLDQGLALPDQLQKAVLKRQINFLAGRFCASTALAQIGYQTSHIPINTDRSPRWPTGVCGSISHTDHHAVAIAGCTADWRWLGIDMEKAVSDEDAERLAKPIVNAFEQEQLRAMPMAFGSSWTLAFSAKESIFKALYPSVQRYFDFKDVQLVDIGLEDKVFTFILGAELEQKLNGLQRVQVNYLLADKLVTTWCIEQQWGD
jgi:enterobactin synthetase component D